MWYPVDSTEAAGKPHGRGNKTVAKEKRENRFEKTFLQSDSLTGGMEIWVDTQTGVNYLYRWSGCSGGMTPLLDRDGKPVVTTVQR